VNDNAVFVQFAEERGNVVLEFAVGEEKDRVGFEIERDLKGAVGVRQRSRTDGANPANRALPVGRGCDL